MRINKPQLFNGQYLASNDAILSAFFTNYVIETSPEVFAITSGAKIKDSLINWSALTGSVYGDAIKIDNAANAKTIKAYIDDKVAGLTSGDIKTISGNLATVSGDLDTLEASVATVSGNVGKIKLEKAANSGDYAEIYTFTDAAGKTVDINIPKDQFLKDAEYVPSAEVLRFTFKLNREDDTDNIVDIPVSGLVDVYTAQESATQIQVSIDKDTNIISASVVAGSIGESELSSTVNASLDLADSALQKADITTGTDNGTIAVEGTDVAVAGLKSAAFAETTAFDPSGAAGIAQKNAKDYTNVVSGVLNTRITNAQTAADEAQADINYVSGQVSGVAGYNVYTGTLSGTLTDADKAKLVTAGSTKTYIDDKVQSVVAGDLTDALANYVKTERVTDTVSAGTNIPTNTAVIDYVASHNAVYTTADFSDPSDKTLTGLYVDPDGNTKFWNGSAFIATSEEVISAIAETSADTAIPDVGAVKAYVSGQVQETIATVNTKAVEMLETEVDFGTNVSAEVSGRIVAVYDETGKQCYPTISYAGGVSTITADAPSETYSVLYAKRIGQANGVLPNY